MDESSYCLKHLTDTELLDGLAHLCRRSNELTAELLAHLNEVEARRLHVLQGHGSMFDYCMSRLGHTEDEAGRRIHAARAAQRFPELLPMLARGEMHLSTINLIAARFDDNDERAQGLIEAARGKTKRQVEEMLAARFAKPEAPTRIVPLASKTTLVAAPRKELQGPSAALPLFTAPAPAAPPPAAMAAASGACLPATTATACAPATPTLPLSETSLPDAPVARFRLQVTISRDARDRLLRAQALLAHNIPNGDLGCVLERALELLCQDLEAKKFGKLKRHAATPPAPVAAVTGTTAAKARSDRPHAPAAEPVPGRAIAVDSGADAVEAIASPMPADGEGTTTPGAASDSDTCCCVARKRRGEGGARPRTIPRAVRRQVAERDGYRCAYVSPDGVRCSETRWLEFHHKTPFARGGEATVDNIALACRLHNDVQARLYYGEPHMEAAKAACRAERERRRRVDASTRSDRHRFAASQGSSRPE